MNEGTNGTVSYRLGEIERRLGEIEAVKPDVLAHVVAELHAEVISLRRTIIGFALATAGSAIIFAFSVFELLRT